MPVTIFFCIYYLLNFLMMLFSETILIFKYDTIRFMLINFFREFNIYNFIGIAKNFGYFTISFFFSLSLFLRGVLKLTEFLRHKGVLQYIRLIYFVAVNCFVTINFRKQFNTFRGGKLCFMFLYDDEFSR